MSLYDRIRHMATGRCRMCDARHQDLVDAQRELVATAADLGETRKALLAARKENEFLRGERVDAEQRAVKAASRMERAELEHETEQSDHARCHLSWRAARASYQQTITHLQAVIASERAERARERGAA